MCRNENEDMCGRMENEDRHGRMESGEDYEDGNR